MKPFLCHCSAIPGTLYKICRFIEIFFKFQYTQTTFAILQSPEKLKRNIYLVIRKIIKGIFDPPKCFIQVNQL